MDKEQFLVLIQKYLIGEATLEEEQLLLNYYGSFQDSEIWNESTMGVKEEIEAKLLARIQAHVSAAKGTRPTVRLWPRIAVAAAAVAAITLGTWLYMSEIASSRRASRNDDLVANDIAPGKNTATLTLANGTIINLDTNRTSVVITDSVKTTTMLTASTPRGGTYQVVLPDGTEAWLNADSKLTFPSNFGNAAQRIVELEGEAYFVVVHNAKQPFRVKSKGQVVEDIGTEFNIEAYPDGAVKTTLIEGLAKVNEVKLIPNQQAILNDAQINVIPIDAAEATAWKRGEFLFNKQALGIIMKQVSRWYDVEIRYEEPQMEKKQFWGSITRFTNVSDVLRMLELTGDVHFKIDGRTIIVKP